MFKFFKSNNESYDGVERKVARHYVRKLQSPYVYYYNGNVRYILDAEPVISGDMVGVFEGKLVPIVRKLIEYNGYASIRNDLIRDVLEENGIDMPNVRNDGEVVYIEDYSKVYSYVPGMKKARQI